MDDSIVVELANVSRAFGAVTALTGVSLAVKRGEFFSLLGPSGCGKTTLLRLIAGLDFPDTGSLQLDGREASQIPAHDRPVNTVFQSYALFPHLNVRDNVSFGLRMKKCSRNEIEVRVREVMELVQVTDLAARKPAELSGGQKQRVALARALVNRPQVLLLDEPLGALDLKLRKELQQELCGLQRRTGITFIYVTHDQDEALSMSDRVAVMNHGAIVQLGPPRDLYETPRTRFVAQFLGGCNLLAAQVRERAGGHVVLQTAVGDLRMEGEIARSSFTLAIRPERIPIGHGTANQLTGEVIETTYTGAETHCLVRVQNEVLRLGLKNSADGTSVQPGARVLINLPPGALMVLED